MSLSASGLASGGEGAPAGVDGEGVAGCAAALGPITRNPGRHAPSGGVQSLHDLRGLAASGPTADARDGTRKPRRASGARKAGGEQAAAGDRDSALAAPLPGPFFTLTPIP